MTLPCQCDGPTTSLGGCPRFPHKVMNASMHALCRLREDYRALWDAQAQGEPPPQKCPQQRELAVIPPELEYALWPGKRENVLRMRRPLQCQHLGQTVREPNGRARTRTYESL